MRADRLFAASVVAAVVLVVAGAIALALLRSSGPASIPKLASGANPRAATSSNSGSIASLAVSPVRLSAPSGERQFGVDFRVTNIGDQAESIAVAVQELSQTGIVLPGGPASAARWVTIRPTMADVPPGQVQVFNAHVDPPEQREAGERRVGVAFRTTVHSQGSVGLSVAISASIFIPGPGPVSRSINIAAVTGPWLANWGPIALTTRIENRGNVHMDLGMPGAEVVATTAAGDRIDFPPATVLPGRTVQLQTVWQNPPVLCWCEVAVATSDGNGRVATSRIHVLVAPWRLGLAVLAAVAGLALLVRLVLRARTGQMRKQRRRPAREREEDTAH